MDSGRRTIIISAAVSAVAIVLLLLLLREGPKAASTSTPAAPTNAPVATMAAPTPVVSAPTPVVASASASAAASILALVDDDSNTPISPEPAKREEKLSLEDQIARRKAGLVLLDDLVAKVEKDRAAAEKAGDAQALKIATQRIERLKKLRVLREKELADIADGGVPDANP